MKYFIDTEFIENGRTIDLISIGMVCEDGRELYVENADADLSKANDWVKDNVIPHLWSRLHFNDPTPNLWSKKEGHYGGLHSKDVIARLVRQFVGAGESEPELWGYYADYDWVAICQLYGTMMDLPKGWPMFCMDLKQEAVRLGNPALPEQSSTEHHALADAKWNMQVWEFLRMEEFHIFGTTSRRVRVQRSV